jgi:hypothetical protein
MRPKQLDAPIPLVDLVQIRRLGRTPFLLIRLLRIVPEPLKHTEPSMLICTVGLN